MVCVQSLSSEVKSHLVSCAGLKTVTFKKGILLAFSWVRAYKEISSGATEEG